MYQPDVVYGLMRDGEELAGTVEDLTAHGIYPSEIELSSPPPGRYVLMDEYLHDDGVGALRGAGVGALAALVIGVVAALGVGATTDLGWIGQLMIVIGFVGFGGLVGGMYGLQVSDHPDDDALRYADLDDTAGWKLVAVHSLHWRNRAHGILLRHGARVLDSPTPVPRG